MSYTVEQWKYDIPTGTQSPGGAAQAVPVCWRFVLVSRIKTLFSVYSVDVIEFGLDSRIY